MEHYSCKYKRPFAGYSECGGGGREGIEVVASLLKFHVLHVRKVVPKTWYTRVTEKVDLENKISTVEP